jgi:hypothetical protein
MRLLTRQDQYYAIASLEAILARKTADRQTKILQQTNDPQIAAAAEHRLQEAYGAAWGFRNAIMEGTEVSF